MSALVYSETVEEFHQKLMDLADYLELQWGTTPCWGSAVALLIRNDMPILPSLANEAHLELDCDDSVVVVQSGSAKAMAMLRRLARRY